MTRRFKVLLCGYYGMGNLGDELLASASINLLQECGVPRGRIAMLSGDPEGSRAAHNVFAIGRFALKEVFSALHESESVLFGGGGIFQDGSSFRSPAYYWGIVRAARFCGCKVWAVGQSIGPLSHSLCRAMARDAFRLCEAVSVRDVHSFEFLANSCTRPRVFFRTEDLTLAEMVFPRGEGFAQESGKDVFLVNFRRTREKIELKAAADLKYFGVPAGKRCLGVAMDRRDAKLMEELASGGTIALDDICIPTLNNVREVFSRACGGFGMRLHFGVMCLRAGVPFAMVPYDPKVTDFAQRWNVPLWPECASFCEKQENPEKQENMTCKLPYDRGLSHGEADYAEIGERVRVDFHACWENVFSRSGRGH